MPGDRQETGLDMYRVGRCYANINKGNGRVVFNLILILFWSAATLCGHIRRGIGVVLDDTLIHRLQSVT